MTAPTAETRTEAMSPEAWLDEHGDCLFAYALRRVRDRSTAEDLVQETLLAAIESRGSFRGDSSARTWLVGILKHKILQHFRRSAREAGPADLPAEVVDGHFTQRGLWKSSLAPWGGRPSADPESQDFRRVLEECLGKLPPRASNAFLLSVQHRLTIDNLCQILETNATNVYAMLYRARFALRQCLERNWFGNTTGP